MKRILFLLIPLLSVITHFCHADPVKDGCYGAGEHLVDNIETWSGSEEVISRVKNGDITYEFIRISEQEFQIKDTSSKELFFRFNKNFGIGESFLSNTKLVDIYREKDKISALLFCEAGYYLISASKSIPPLEKGRYLANPAVTKVDGWHFAFCVSNQDYYWNRDIGESSVQSKIKAVKLTGIETIQFTYQSPKGGPTETDTFITKSGKFIEENGRIEPEDGSLFKNGVKIGSSGFSAESDETQFVYLFNELMALKDVKETVIQFSGNKEEFLSMILANNRDKKNYDAIKKRVDEAFAEK